MPNAYVSLLSALLMLAPLTIFAETPTINQLIQSAQCETPACFAKTLKEHDFCFIKEQEASWGTMYLHQICNSPSKKIPAIRYAVMKENKLERNASITIESDGYAKETVEYLIKQGYKEEDSENGQRWFESEKPKMSVLVEKIKGEKDKGEPESFWHIGLVWEISSKS